MVTLKDIAKEAGVSSVTVSNVVHKNYKKVSAENVKKIEELIEKYHYVPNASAQSLAGRKSMIIGIVIPNVAPDENFLTSPYNAEMIGVLEKEIRENGYYLMVRSTSKCSDAIPLIRTWNVDGVIFMGATDSDVAEIKKQLKLPTVFVDTYSKETDFSNIGVEDKRGGYIATKYLVSNGHKDIWIAGPEVEGLGVIPERYAGYVKAMQESNLSDHIFHMEAPITSYDCGVDVGKRIAFSDRNVTAVFATADILALGIIEGLRLSGKRVPEDISVVGFDNLPDSKYAWPKLTTITQNIPQKARFIAGTLLKQIKSGGDEFVRESLDVELVERNSVRNLDA